MSGRSSAKGNITFSAGYQQQQAVMAGDRDFSASTSSFNYTCDPADPTCKVGGTTLQGSVATPGGYIDTLDSNGKKAFTPVGCTSDICTADKTTPGAFRNFVDPTATHRSATTTTSRRSTTC